MIIDLALLPEEGRQIQGEETGFDLGSADLRVEGPLEYDLWVQSTGKDLVVQGLLKLPMTFECVVCLKDFSKSIRVSDFLYSQPVGGLKKVDLTDQFREDILLALPSHPRCDSDGGSCPGHPAVATRSEPSREDGIWKSLDGLNLGPKENQRPKQD